MITAQTERWGDCLPELKALFPAHWEELALNKDKVPLSPDYATYARVEAAGELFLATLREDGRLAGYFVGIVAPGLHYSTCLTCILDLFWVHPKARGHTAELRLFRHVRSELEERGVQRWIAGSKLHNDCGRLYEALGFEQTEKIYSMWIGD